MKYEQFEFPTRQKSFVMTARDVAELGTGQVAYINKVQIGGLTLFAVTAANGALLALAPCHKAAVAKVMESDLKLVNIH